MSTPGKAGRPTTWLYKVRQEGSGGALTVPRPVFEQIPPNALFRLTITDNGLLYELTTEATAVGEISWAAPKTSSTRKRGS